MWSIRNLWSIGHGTWFSSIASGMMFSFSSSSLSCPTSDESKNDFSNTHHIRGWNCPKS